MYCQVCGTLNPDEQEFCARCNSKLLVLSGLALEEDGSYEESSEESFSFDEHLLERISILEEAVKRTAETVRQLLSALHKQERNLLINQTGVTTLRELLEQKQVVGWDEWSELWESKMDYQLLALEKRERFVSIKERIAALHHGDKRKLFLQHLEDAEYALFAFDIERAVRALETAFKLDRDNYELAYFLGETHFNEGEPEQALAYFGRVLEVKPDHYEGLVYSGVILYERGEHPRAEESLKRAVALYPETFLPNFSLGAVYASQGNLAKAVLFLERAVKVEAVPQALYLLGSCLYEMGRLSQATRSLQEAVRLDPAFEEAHHLLGLAYLDRHWNRKALDAFRRAQRLNPKKLQYQDLVRYLSGPAGGAPLPQVQGEAASWLGKGEEALKRDNLKQALTCYRRALALEPDNPTLLMSYALVCLHLDRGQEIEAVTRKVLDLNPGEMLEATAYAALIESLRSQGKYREGNRVGRRLLDAGRSAFAKSIAYYEMAYNLAEMEEDLDEALDYARQALEHSPEELRQFPLAALGWVHYKRKEFEKAIDFLSRSSELGPTSTTLTHLGMALLASGDEDKARNVLAHARALGGGRGEGLEEKMMEWMKDSTRLHERVRRGQRK
ncbi:MAG TPA: tetratricopeptide repeat protein [Thermoanaerobaculia bacterium]|nr:tetratricopeptide repeat protein [Thermoanaerobaculia bacterium]